MMCATASTSTLCNRAVRMLICVAIGDGPHEVAWSAALSRALCFIRRVVAASNAPAGYGPQPRILCLRLVRLLDLQCTGSVDG